MACTLSWKKRLMCKTLITFCKTAFSKFLTENASTPSVKLQEFFPPKIHRISGTLFETQTRSKHDWFLFSLILYILCEAL